MLRILHNTARGSKFWFIVLVSLAIVAAISFISLNQGPPLDAIQVSLADKSVVPQVLGSNSDDYNQPGNSSLRVAIAGVLSPSSTLEAYQDLLTHMGHTLDRQVTMILKPTYAEINDMLMGQRADIAFVCSLAYVKGNQDFGMELLVAPQINEEIIYYSYLIVPEVSSTSNMEDLRGRSFAFTDPISNTGHLAPSYQLSLLGETTASFFGSYYFTYSHDTSVRAVADRLVDGAAVDSLVYEQMIAKEPELASKVKIIARWGPYGMPPTVVNPELDSQIKRQLQDFFLGMHDSDEGRNLLNILDIDQFKVVPDDLYDSIREMTTKLGW
jgi:phosphonate transport system substrate-binding protein